jgi:NADPH2:quinone reductase
MKAILIDDQKNLNWSDVPEPICGENDVLVQIHAAAVNRADLMQREGIYPSPPGWPEWMGLEVAGVVLKASENGRFKPGDKVCALLGGGGYAERAAIPADMVLPIPDGFSMIEASAIPEAFTTSYLNIFIEGGMQSDDTVFIQAGASGLGMAAIQMVKAFGGKVVTTVGSEEKFEFVRKLGADVIINHKHEDIAAIMKEHPADIAMDCVAGAQLGRCLQTMSRGGRWIIIATLGGPVAEINMTDFFKRGIKLIGSTLRSRTSEMKAKILGEIENKLWDKFSAGQIRPVIYKTLSITQAQVAHTILQNNENLGKVVLVVK